MGKGKRTRENNSENFLQNPGATAVAKNKTNTMTKIALIAIAVILVATLILVFIQSSGIVLRVNAVYETENFKVTGTMMQYMVNAQYQNFYSNYGAYPSLFGIDTTKSLKDQAFDPSNYYISLFMNLGDEYKDFKGTWYDYFWTAASRQATSSLALCEAAKAAGVSLGKEEKDNIQATIDSMYKDMDSINESNRKTYAESYGQQNYVTFGSIKDYLNACYGNGVSISDIRNTLEIVYLSEKYYNMVSEDMLEDLKNDDEKVKEYYNNNLSNYYKADYLTFTFSASYTKPSSTATADVEKAWNEYIKSVNEALDYAKALSETGSETEFKTYLIKYWFEDAWQTQYDKTIKDLKGKDNEDGTGKVLTDEDIPEKDIINEKKDAALVTIIDAILTEKKADELEPSGDTAFDGAIDAIRESLLDSINTKYKAITVKMAKYDETTDEGKWLFNENRYAGDNKYFASHEATFVGTTEEPEDSEGDEAADEPEAQAEESTGNETGAEDTPEETPEEDKPLNWEVKLDKDKSEDASFTVEVRFVLKTRYILEDAAREFGHILLSEDSFLASGDKSDAGKEKAKAEAKAELEKLLAEFKANTELTKEVFEAKANEWTNAENKKLKTEDSGVFYEEVIPGMMVESINDWLFNSERKAGDLEIVESDYGYHLMYLVEISEDPAWLIEARADLYSEDLEKWVDDCETKHAPKSNENFIKNSLKFIG